MNNNTRGLSLGKKDFASVVEDQSNNVNQTILQNEMKNKVNYSTPYYATNKTVLNISTDFNNFPYNRWYRGIASVPVPIIIEREAGYSKQDKCNPVNMKYRNIVTSKGPRDSSEDQKGYPRVLALNGYIEGPRALQVDHCFEAAPSTVYPCFNSRKSFSYKDSSLNSASGKEEAAYGVVISP